MRTLASSRVRWRVKKVARAAAVMAAWSSGWLTFRRLLAPAPRVRVLTYHRFGDRPGDPFCVPTAEFRRQMEWLAERQLAISLEDLQAFVAGEKTLKDGSVLVTVDDGFHDYWSEALPILSSLGLPSVVFIPAGDVPSRAASDRCDEEPERKLSWSEIATLPRRGAVVGSHSFHHRSLGGLPADEVRYQASASRLKLEQAVGAPVTAFAYPFGTKADFTDETRDILDECGYRWVFTSQHGAIRPGADRRQLPRIKVEGGDRFWMFRLAARGGLDLWALVDRIAWRLQQSERWAQ